MAKQILLDNVISKYDLSARIIREKLAEVSKDEDVEFAFATPGGSVYDGIEIYNVIHDFCMTHSGKITFRIVSIAASMGSYVYLAGKAIDKNIELVVEENSIYMIHNPWGFAIGDYREMANFSVWLERLAGLMGLKYASASGRPEKDVREEMDAESYFIGQEIVDAGFADRLVESKKEKIDDPDAIMTDRNALIVKAKISIDKAKAIAEKECREAMAEHKNIFEQAVALIHPSENLQGIKAEKNTNTASAGMERSMTLDELKAKDSACYEAAISAGVQQERKRVSAHLKMGESSGDLAISAKFIREGNSLLEEDVVAEYHSASMKKHLAKVREEDNPKGFTPGTSGSADDGTEEALAAFDKELGFDKEDEK